MGFFCSFQKATLCDPGIDTHGLPELFRIQGCSRPVPFKGSGTISRAQGSFKRAVRFGFRGLGLRDIKTRNHCIYDSLNP